MNIRPQFARLSQLFSDFRFALGKSLILSVLSIAVACMASGVLLFADDARRTVWLGENQIVESLSAWLYVFVAVLLVLIGIGQWFSRSISASGRQYSHPWLLATLMVCFAAREMDFHSRFTGGSVMKTSYYLSAEHGWMAKLIPLLVMGLIAVLVIRIFAGYRGVFFTRLRRGEMLGVLPMTAFLLVVISKGFDSGMGTLMRNGWVSSGHVVKLTGGIEEISELFIPCLFLTAFMLAFRDVFFRVENRVEYRNDKIDAKDSRDDSSSQDLPMAA